MINLKRKELSLFIHYRSCLTDAVRFFDIVSAEQIWDIKITYTFRVMCIETEPTGEKSRSKEMGVMERKKHFEHKSEQSIVKFWAARKKMIMIHLNKWNGRWNNKIRTKTADNRLWTSATKRSEFMTRKIVKAIEYDRNRLHTRFMTIFSVLNTFPSPLRVRWSEFPKWYAILRDREEQQIAKTHTNNISRRPSFYSIWLWRTWNLNALAILITLYGHNSVRVISILKIFSIIKQHMFSTFSARISFMPFQPWVKLYVCWHWCCAYFFSPLSSILEISKFDYIEWYWRMHRWLKPVTLIMLLQKALHSFKSIHSESIERLNEQMQSE